MAARVDSSQLDNGLRMFNEKVKAAVTMYGETVAKDFEGYAKSHRPWTDRTGHARQRLNGYTEDIKDGVRVNIAHGVDYGIWLEYAHEKKYAILEPTVRLKSNDVLKGLKTLLDGIKVY